MVGRILTAMTSSKYFTKTLILRIQTFYQEIRQTTTETRIDWWSSLHIDSTETRLWFFFRTAILVNIGLVRAKPSAGRETCISYKFCLPI